MNDNVKIILFIFFLLLLVLVVSNVKDNFNGDLFFNKNKNKINYQEFSIDIQTIINSSKEEKDFSPKTF